MDTAMYNRAGADELRRRLSCGCLAVQGPMGSLLTSEPFGEDIPAALWNVAEGATVERLHRLYLAAGAELLITNTFQANAPALSRDLVRSSVRNVCDLAVRHARRASAKLLLGSMGPCGIDWFAPGAAEYTAAVAAYREQALALLEAGVDGILLETFTSIRDLEPALVGVHEVLDGMPLAVSFAVDGKAELLGDHLNIEAAVRHVQKRGGADMLGINCCTVEEANSAVPRLLACAEGIPVMVRPNAGMPHRDEAGALEWDEDPQAMADAARAWREAGVRAVGGCCGTTPKTTCAVADVLDV